MDASTGLHPVRNQGAHRPADRGFSGPPGTRGFSLYELLIGLALAAVLTTLAYGMRPLIQDERLRAHVNRLATDLHLARTEAIKRGLRVVVCRSRNGTACASDGNWQDGWILFADLDADNHRDSGEDVLRIQEALPPEITLRYSSYAFLAYKPDGGVTRDGTFVFCDGRGSSRARAIVIHWTGRARIAARSSDNKALSCSL